MKSYRIWLHQQLMLRLSNGCGINYQTKVHTLHIAQMKEKFVLEKHPKPYDGKSPKTRTSQVTPEKAKMIEAAFRYFKLIPHIEENLISSPEV